MPRKKRRKTAVRTRRTRAKRRSRASSGLDLKDSTRRQVSGIAQICIGILLVLVLKGNAGPVGDMINRGLTFLFGAWSILFPAFLFLSGGFHCIAPTGAIEVKRSTGLFLCLLAFLGMVHLGAPPEDFALKRDLYAGAIGFLMSVPFVLFATKAVGYTVLASAFAGGVFIAFEPDVGSLLRLLSSLFIRQPAAAAKTRTRAALSAQEEEEDQGEDLIEEDREAPELNIVRPVFAQQLVKQKAKEQIRKEARAAKPVSKNTLEMKDTRFEEWTFPSFDLLDNVHSELTVNDEELKSQARQIEEKLEEFGIEVTMREAHPGPTVTQFTLEPSEGVRLSKIGGLKDDLALALAAESLRIEAPIPGKSLVGVEMPNRVRTIVHLREILESPQFHQSESQLTFPLGRNVSGDAIVADLADMPHLLIAGATGSGKSVCMNTFLTALLFQNAPHELKLILIDPKRVELMPYDGIPHLLTPVITESEKALQALRWAVAEMGRRLHRFSEAGARNIDEFNEKQMEEENILPRIVIVVDELADLMMRQFRRDTETMVARIAQMARATGMHLIIATQRPSVDVITGLIKANIPTRISFRTVSAVDSRTIIDSIGAEDLLGKGDMLYMTAATSRPTRIQGIYISTKEVERVINAVKIAGGGRITEQIPMIERGEDAEEGEEEMKADGYIDLEADDNGGDDLFFEAVRIVQSTGRASASLLQRQLKVGYARAARLLDIMEEKGLIGPADGAKARKVYMEVGA
ncbi:MAG: DNA translocase FtsK [Candidatus Peribacteraceae bacterium]|nr:DNA translocase FtsK [Candidatus Peribacteraceae bacterium]